jgi:hypothetical protein
VEGVASVTKGTHDYDSINRHILVNDDGDRLPHEQGSASVFHGGWVPVDGPGEGLRVHRGMPVAEREFGLAEVSGAEGDFAMGSIAGLAAAVEVDGRKIGEVCPGTVLSGALPGYAALIERDCAATMPS